MTGKFKVGNYIRSASSKIIYKIVPEKEAKPHINGWCENTIWGRIVEYAASPGYVGEYKCGFEQHPEDWELYDYEAQLNKVDIKKLLKVNNEV